MYELKKKLEKYLRVNLLGPGPRLIKKRIYRASLNDRHQVSHPCETRDNIVF